MSQSDLSGASFFVDDGFSGTSFENRPEFQRMLQAFRDGEFNVCCIKDLSRLSRNYIEAGTFIEQVFPMLGVRFISILDNIDSYTKPEDLDSILIPIKNLLHDSYARDISVKIRSSLTAKQKQGEFIGSFAAFGYQKDPEDKHKLVIDEETAPIVRNIFNWYIGGTSTTRIAKKLNALHIDNPYTHRKKKSTKRGEIPTDKSSLWCAETVSRILENRVYRGDMA